MLVSPSSPCCTGTGAGTSTSTSPRHPGCLHGSSWLPARLGRPPAEKGPTACSSGSTHPKATTRVEHHSALATSTPLSSAFRRCNACAICLPKLKQRLPYFHHPPLARHSNSVLLTTTRPCHWCGGGNRSKLWHLALLLAVLRKHSADAVAAAQTFTITACADHNTPLFVHTLQTAPTLCPITSCDNGPSSQATKNRMLPA